MVLLFMFLEEEWFECCIVFFNIKYGCEEIWWYL